MRLVQCRLRMATEQLCVRHDSFHPWQHYGAVALLGNPNPGLHTPVNMNSPDVDGTLVNVNSPGIDRTPMNVNDPDVDGNQTDWTSPHNNFPHYQISLLGCLGPFFGAHPLLPTSNLSPVCATAQVPHLYC